MRKHLSNPRSSENRFPFRYISSSGAALARPGQACSMGVLTDPARKCPHLHLTTPTTAVPAPYLLRTSRLVPKPHPHHHAIVGRRNGHHRASPRKDHTQKRPVPPETGSQTSSSYRRPRAHTAHTGTPTPEVSMSLKPGSGIPLFFFTKKIQFNTDST